MKPFKEIILIATALLIYPLSSFSQQDTTRRDTMVPESIKQPIEFPGADLKEHDKIPVRVIDEKASELIRNVYSAHLQELRLAEQAKTKAVTDEVKAFAVLISKEHSAMVKEIHVLADKNSIVLPDTLPNEKVEIVNELIKQTGKDYDIAYAALTVKRHKELVEMSEEAAQSCKDPEIRQWLENMLPKMRHHLEEAKNLPVTPVAE